MGVLIDGGRNNFPDALGERLPLAAIAVADLSRNTSHPPVLTWATRLLVRHTMKKHYPLLFLLLAAFPVAIAQQVVTTQPVATEASYSLLANLSNQSINSPALPVSLAPTQIHYLVEVRSQDPHGFKSVTIDYSTDGKRWQLQRSLPIAYLNPNSPGMGTCSAIAGAALEEFLQANRRVYVRLSFFNQQGLLCEEFIQKGILFEDVQSRQVHRLNKGMQLLAYHKQLQSTLAQTSSTVK